MNRAKVAHHMPGRARVRVAGRRGDVAYFTSAVRTLGTLDGVVSVTARPETGSILVHHRLSLEAIARFARQRGIFALDLADEEEDDAVALQEVIATGKRALRAVAGENVDGPAALALIAIAAFQASRGQVFGPTVTHLVQALDFLRRSLR